MADKTPTSDDKALARYQVISAYIALNPPRGQRRALLEQLASRVWQDARGEAWTVSAETIRTWVRRYRVAGLDGLRDKPRPKRGVQALTPEQIALVCDLKREVPERSIVRLIEIAEQVGLVEPGVLRRSTVHRVLQAHDLSRRPTSAASTKDLDRFEAAAPNDLWQSDMLVGPWLPDPKRPDKVRRAFLYAFLDDHSRLLLHGRFSFKGDLPALELVFRRALQKYGVPKKVYYDNGQVYRSGHMKRIVAHTGIHRVVHTQAHRPEGHGKIEAFNKLCRSAFIAELKATSVSTIDELNELFSAWVDCHYNLRVHSDTGEVPRERWRAGIDRVRYIDERKLHAAFQFVEHRTPDKAGVLSLFGVRYQVGPKLARRRVEVRYDPEDLAEIEVWHDDSFVQRSRPLEVQPHRRPQPATTEVADAEDVADAEVVAGPKRKPVGDWLGTLLAQRRAALEAPPPPLHSGQANERKRADAALVALLEERLPDAVFDEATAVGFLAMYGPFETEQAAAVLDELASQGRGDAHITEVLEAIRARSAQPGDQP